MDQWQVDLFVPVPLHPSRVSVRGYNQSERIATELSRLSGIPMARAIARHRSTSSQVGLSGSERRVNVLGAFRYEMSLEGLSVALIDDVVTTGSTIVESARACTSAGASVVVAATLATEIQDH
jgi:ComF family protein